MAETLQVGSDAARKRKRARDRVWLRADTLWSTLIGAEEVEGAGSAAGGNKQGAAALEESSIERDRTRLSTHPSALHDSVYR